jgi:peptide/nickel transport system ATP-binding protein
MNVLELQDIHVVHKRPGAPPVNAVNGVSLSLAPGEVVGLVGESGCGKSSLARVAMGIDAPSKGRALFRGEPIQRLGAARRRGKVLGLQMVFQNPYASLSPRRTIASQLLDGLPRGERQGTPRQEAERLLELVGLDPAGVDKYPHQFSGGQRQRLAIARALAAKPEVIVADEPVTALDAFSAAQIVTLLTELVRELNMGMLFISHDLSLVRAIANRTAVMYAGEIVEEGPSEQLWAHPGHEYTRKLIAAIPEIGTTKQLPGLPEENGDAHGANAGGSASAGR